VFWSLKTYSQPIAG